MYKDRVLQLREPDRWDLVGLSNGYAEFAFSEDAQDKDYQRLKIKRNLTDPGFSGKQCLKQCVFIIKVKTRNMNAHSEIVEKRMHI